MFIFAEISVYDKIIQMGLSICAIYYKFSEKLIFLTPWYTHFVGKKC